MNFGGLKLLRIINPNGCQKLSLLSKWNGAALLPSCKLSTSNTCIQQSSEEEFILRHQTYPNTTKSSNSNWMVYRMASLGLLGSLAACCFFPGNIVVDFATVTLLVHHNHFGMKSVIADYAPLFFKDGMVKMFMGVWLLVSIVTLALLYNFNYNNIGFSKALVKFFSL